MLSVKHGNINIFVLFCTGCFEIGRFVYQLNVLHGGNFQIMNIGMSLITSN